MSSLSPYPEYKDSGVSWLGQIPTSWETSPIARLSEAGNKKFVDGDWIEAPFIEDSGVRLIQTGNIGVGEYREKGFRFISDRTFSLLKCTEIKPGDLLICRLGDPVGRSCIAPDLGGRMITSVDVCILKLSDAHDVRFINYAHSSAGFLSYISSLVRGSTRDRVSRSMLGRFRLPTPPLSQQRAIASYLDYETGELDTFIADLEQLIALLNERRAATITQAVTKGINTSSPTRDSGYSWIGHTPAHWEIRPSKSLFSCRSEKDRADDVHLTPSQIHGVLPQEEYMEVTGSRVVLSLAGNAMKHVEQNDFIIHLRSFQGGIEWSRYNGKVSPAYTVLTPGSDVVPEFFKYTLKSKGYVSQIASLTDQLRDGQSMRYDDFGMTPLPTPPVSEQKQIARQLDSELAELDAAIQDAKHSIELSKERRSALISAAVTGKIDVRNTVTSQHKAA